VESQAPEEEDVNYVFEMFKHESNVWGLCAALIGGSIAAIATGIAPAILIPVVAQAGINGILSLFLPESPVFREAIDRKKRKGRRAAARKHLVEEINKRVAGPHRNWETYHRMVEQLGSLSKTAKNTDTDLSLWDIERLDETTVNFLRFWLARLTIVERQNATDTRQVQSRARELQRKLKSDSLSSLDRVRLQRALADLDKVLQRRDSFDVQDSSMAAQMLAMADGFSEVYHRIMANPTGDDVGSFLNDAVDRMNVSEELDFAADLEIDALLGASQAARAAVKQSLDDDREQADMDEAMRKAPEGQGRKAKRQKQRSKK
jgi:hypothetical protein